MGDRLIVGVSTDEFNMVKGKKTIIPYEQRVEILNSCRYVDLTFAENTWEQKPVDIARFEAHIFAMGSDWEGKFDNLKEFCQVIYLPRTENISTTEIKDHVKLHYGEKLNQIKQSLALIIEDINTQ